MKKLTIFGWVFVILMSSNLILGIIPHFSIFNLIVGTVLLIIMIYYHINDNFDSIGGALFKH